MDFILQRISDNKTSTIGMLLQKIQNVAKPVLEAWTLEDEFRDVKVAKETRIPAGFYEIGLQKIETPKTLAYRQKYPWFVNHLEIQKVPNFKGVYIHIGNNDDDTEGCVLLGDAVDNNNIGPGTITNSTIAFKRFYSKVHEHLLNGGKVLLEIRDEDKLL